MAKQSAIEQDGVIVEALSKDVYKRQEVANYNQVILNHSISPLDNHAQIKQLRRTIARMKTELRQSSLLRIRRALSCTRELQI